MTHEEVAIPRHGQPDAALPSADELAALHIEHGMPADYAPILAALDRDIAAGSENRVTAAVEELTGRAPRSFEEFVGEWFTVAAD